MEALWYVLVAVAAIAVGVFVGMILRKKIAEGKIGSAEEEAKRIVLDGEKQAATKKKEALIEAKEEILKQRNESEREMKERRAEISKTERRLVQKEENLDKKSEALEKKNEQLDKKLKENDAIRAQVEEALAQQRSALERISGLTAEEAKAELLENLETVAKFEFAQRMDELEEQFKDEADEKARNYISLAIQRCAADHVAETTVTAVAIPSEDMKGRIIGREGRNILKLETLTGVELIIDDTPDAITLSGFDPVRREVARLALEKLPYLRSCRVESKFPNKVVFTVVSGEAVIYTEVAGEYYALSAALRVLERRSEPSTFIASGLVYASLPPTAVSLVGEHIKLSGGVDSSYITEFLDVLVESPMDGRVSRMFFEEKFDMVISVDAQFRIKLGSPDSIKLKLHAAQRVIEECGFAIEEKGIIDVSDPERPTSLKKNDVDINARRD